MLKRMILVMALLLPVPALAADTAMVVVHGMVCEFGAQSIEATVKEREEVTDVAIDLDQTTVTLTFAKGKSLDEQTIAKLIDQAGYQAVTVSYYKDGVLQSPSPAK